MTKPRLAGLLIVLATTLGIALSVRWCADPESDIPSPDRDPGPSEVTEAFDYPDPPPVPTPAAPKPADPNPSSGSPKPTPEPVILVVVDADDRSPAVGAHAWATVDWALPSTVVVSTGKNVEFTHGVPETHALHRGVWSDDRDGRIVLDPGRDSLSLLVWAPGHAWRQVEVARAHGAEIEVPLSKGGELRLRIPMIAELRLPRIHSQVDGIEIKGDLRLPAPRRSEEILLCGLLTGLHLIEVRDGPDGRAIGSGEVEILDGRTAELTIDIMPDPVKLAELSGSFSVPGLWRDTPLRVVLSNGKGEVAGRADLSDEREDPDESVQTFGPLGVPPGRYILAIDPIQWRTWVTVPPSGTNLEVVLPVPAKVQIRLVDRATGKALAESSEPEVAWSLGFEGLTSYFLEEAEADPETGAFRILSPPGSLVVDAMAEGYLEGSLILPAEAGKSYERTIALRRAAILVVLFTLDGEPFPTDGIRVAVKYLRGEQEGAMNVMSSEGDSVTFSDLEAGRVGIEFMLPAGFKAVTPRELDIRTGERRELSIELERE